MSEKRTYEISFIIEVDVDEAKLLRDYTERTPEDVAQAKSLLDVALNDPAAEDFLMMNEISAQFVNIGSDMTTVLSGLDEGDYTPITNVLKTLAKEDRKLLVEEEDGESAYEILADALKAKLDHVHVHKLQAHTHSHQHQQQVVPQSQGRAAAGKKQRHHKGKPGRR